MYCSFYTFYSECPFFDYCDTRHLFVYRNDYKTCNTFKEVQKNGYFVIHYDYISDYDYNEPTYDVGIEKCEKEMDGGKLMIFISHLLSDSEIISIESDVNTICICTFNPHNGTSSDILIKYEEIKNEKK